MGLFGFLRVPRAVRDAEELKQRAKRLAQSGQRLVDEAAEKSKRAAVLARPAFEPIPRNDYLIRPDPIFGFGGLRGRGKRVRAKKKKRKRWNVIGEWPE